MRKESATPDLAEINRKTLDAVNRRYFDAPLTCAVPDAVYDTSPSGLCVDHGEAAIRDFIEGRDHGLDRLCPLAGFDTLPAGHSDEADVYGGLLWVEAVQGVAAQVRALPSLTCRLHYSWRRTVTRSTAAKACP